jgi:integrase
MPRLNKIWFRKDTGWWMTTLAGKKIRLAEGLPNRKTAEQKFHELKAVTAQAPEAPTARVADVIEAFLDWACSHLQPETLRNLKRYGEMFAEHSGYILASAMKPIHLTRWIDGKNWGPTTERNARRSISRVFSWACEQGVLPSNPLKGMRCPRAKTRQRILTDGEFRALLRASDRDFKVLLYSLSQTGCRPKEARTLRWTDVREDRWVLTEHKTAYKTGKTRTIFLTQSMQKLMQVLRKKSNSEFVFVNARQQPWTVNAMRLRIARIKRNTDLAKDVCCYLFRHAWGTNAILNGVDPITVATCMGHSSLEMISKVYVHLADKHEHLQQAMEKAGRRVPSKLLPDDQRLGA